MKRHPRLHPFYLRGLRAVAGVEAAFRFVVQENFAPYESCVIALSPQWMELADKKVAYAIKQWGTCLASNRWPGYPTRTCWAELPGWEETRWLERRYREGVGVEDDGHSPIGDLLDRAREGR